MRDLVFPEASSSAPRPMPEGAFGPRLTRYLGGMAHPIAMMQTPAGHILAVDLLRSPTDRPLESLPIPPEDAFHVMLQRQDQAPHEVWLDGRPIRTAAYPRDSISVIDLCRSARLRIGTPREALIFYLDRGAIGEISTALGTQPADTLALAAGTAVQDPVMARIGDAIMALHGAGIPQPQLMEHLLLAAQAHLVSRYGSRQAVEPTLRGGLALWQERRVKELMSASLNQPLSLAELAGAVSLSVAHFSRAFRVSTGMAPYAWQKQRRVERAKKLLLARTHTIGEIAHLLGYADQSAFTRAFTKATGLPPAAWLRQARG